MVIQRLGTVGEFFSEFRCVREVITFSPKLNDLLQSLRDPMFYTDWLRARKRKRTSMSDMNKPQRAPFPPLPGRCLIVAAATRFVFPMAATSTVREVAGCGTHANDGAAVEPVLTGGTNPPQKLIGQTGLTGHHRQ
ncbi:hypothetical protein PCANC_24129 [Puccinia coronata f. sp. avenae]|uniref:Uncharacterized protein n=1 Tax=Puccinia coronata f. sp. avenae TaxID=200324 RepID=A0A2N5TYR3_9BASI|nr:hypothetical protein PCANC_24129 [Puccinia coronata f. sp. avenae]